MSHSKVKDVDKGYKKVLIRANQLHGVVIEVGLSEASAAVPKINPRGEFSELTLGDVAAVHEFGLGTSPRRSFVADWFDFNLLKNKAILFKATTKMLYGKGSLFGALSGLGMRFRNSMKKRIRTKSDPQYPPNSAATIKRKGSNIPLIETEQLYDSIGYEVKGFAEGVLGQVSEGSDHGSD